MADIFHRTTLFSRTSNRKIWLAALAFVFALGIPTAVLVYTSYQQIKFESIHQQRLLAEELTLRIEQQLQDWIAKEEVRTFADYNFLVVQGDAVTNFLQPSPLADLDVPSDLPGLIGYFQVDAEGKLTSPMLPDSPQQAESYGINQQQFSQRQSLFNELQQILLDNDLLPAKVVEDQSLERDLASTSQATLGRDGSDAAGVAETVSDAYLAEEENLAKERAAPMAPLVITSNESSLVESNASMTPPQDGFSAPIENVSRDKNANQNQTAARAPASIGVKSVRSVPQPKNQSGFDQLLQEQRKQEAEFTAEVGEAELKKAAADKFSVNKSKNAVDETVATGSRLVRTEKIQLPEPTPAPVQEIRLIDDIDAVTPSASESMQNRRQAAELTVAERTTAPIRAPEAVAVQNDGVTNNQTHITLFESEVEPMEFARLTGGNWIFFRKVWRDGKRIIQGGLVDSEVFVEQAFGEPFFSTGLSNSTMLEVLVNGYVINGFFRRGRLESLYRNAAETRDHIVNEREMLYQRYLSTPFNSLELRFGSINLPLGPGGRVISWAALIMAVVLLGGCYLLVRIGTRQLNLVRQQQDFVSAVSHELKTPLTSIRMYGEMLRAGWASEEKRKQYYDYIYDESERLSRLISNVLQLARMNRNELSLVIKPVAVAELLDNVRSKLEQQIDTAGFAFELHCDEKIRNTTVQVDTDAFMQVIINLVDNAIKFSKKAEVKKVMLTVEPGAELNQRFTTVCFKVRDFGPGVAKPHLKKIFGLFYRAENELTRETVGTGIGLALVNQLVRSMGGSVDVVNCEPGAEFRVVLTSEGSR